MTLPAFVEKARARSEIRNFPARHLEPQVPAHVSRLFEIIRTTRFDAALKQTRFRTNWPARRQQQAIQARFRQSGVRA